MHVPSLGCCLPALSEAPARTAQAYTVCFCLNPDTPEEGRFRALVLSCVGRSWTFQSLLAAAVEGSSESGEAGGDGMGGLAWVLQEEAWGRVTEAYHHTHRKVMELHGYLKVAAVRGGHVADLWAHFDSEFYRREAERMASF
jgi:hypothetical protein